MVLAKTLYGSNGELLLTCGIILNQNYINSILRLKYPGVYINDDLSQDIEVFNVISDEMRIKAINSVKKVFVKTQFSHQAYCEHDMNQLIGNIVNELLLNKNMMINMIDLKCFDNYTYAHSVNVAVLSIIIGIAMDLNKNSLIKLGLGAIMHDIGKVFVDKNILNTPGALTDEEFTKIKTHSSLGFAYAKKQIRLPSVSCQAIQDHHEKYDGSGYPNGKQKDKISLFGRIITISDVYDALTSERPYRKALTPSESMEYIMSGCGSLFDPAIVDIFIRKIAPYPIGTTVQLSNNWIGIVVENFESLCLRPTVRIIEQDGTRIEPFDICLQDDPRYLSVIIKGVVDL